MIRLTKATLNKTKIQWLSKKNMWSRYEIAEIVTQVKRSCLVRVKELSVFQVKASGGREMELS